MEKARITVGPVVGPVGPRDARVLAEFSFSGEVECRLFQAGEEKKGMAGAGAGICSGHVTAFIPHVFAFSGLSPSTLYQISFSPRGRGGEEVPGATSGARIRTAKESGPEGIVVVSREHEGKSGGIWAELVSSITTRDEVDMCIHLGGLVETASILSKAQELSETMSGKPLEDAVQNLYRERFRAMWTRPEMALVLATVSNHFVASEDDYFPQFGHSPAHRDTRSFEHMVAQQASKVMHDYLDQLQSDPGAAAHAQQQNQQHGQNQHQHYQHQQSNQQQQQQQQQQQRAQRHHFHAIGDLGIAILDSRGAVFSRLPSELERGVGVLGRAQWDEFSAALSRGGVFDSVANLLVVSSELPSFLGVPVTSLGEDKANSFGSGTLSHPSNRAEQVRLLYSVKEWKARRKGKRDAAFLSACDVSFFSTVIFPDNTQVHQHATGRIGGPLQARLRAHTLVLEQRDPSFISTIEGGLGIDHFHLCREPVFSMLTVDRTSVEGKVAIDVELIRAPHASSSSGSKTGGGGSGGITGSLCGLFAGSSFKTPKDPVVLCVATAIDLATLANSAFSSAARFPSPDRPSATFAGAPGPVYLDNPKQSLLQNESIFSNNGLGGNDLPNLAKRRAQQAPLPLHINSSGDARAHAELLNPGLIQTPQGNNNNNNNFSILNQWDD